MTGLVRAAAAGGAGVFIGEYLAPHVEKLVKPDTDFARKATRAATAAAATGAAYYAIGMLTGKGA
jgi:hypothetical protein